MLAAEPLTDLPKRPVVRSRPPPAALMRAVNPLMRAVIRSPLGRHLEPLAVLRFSGRRTGARRGALDDPDRFLAEVGQEDLPLADLTEAHTAINSFLAALLALCES
jgi:hypothetical protein